MVVVAPMPGRCHRDSSQALDFPYKAATSKPILFLLKSLFCLHKEWVIVIFNLDVEPNFWTSQLYVLESRHLWTILEFVHLDLVFVLRKSVETMLRNRLNCLGKYVITVALIP